MAKILDFGVSESVKNDVLEMVESQGYSVEEAIPGIALSILALAEQLTFDWECEQALDEAVDIITDADRE